MTQKDEAGGAAGSLGEMVERLAGICGGELRPFMSIIKEFILDPHREEMLRAIAEARAIDIESLPLDVVRLDVVRYWVVATDVLGRHGYTITFETGDWYANPNYTEIVARPRRESDDWFHDNPPLIASFIISKRTNMPATRAEILESLRKHHGDEPVDYDGMQIHGIELLLDATLGIPDLLGLEVAFTFRQATQQAMGASKLLRRRNVKSYCECPSGYHRSYAFGCIVLYQPQTPEEAVQFKAPDKE